MNGSDTRGGSLEKANGADAGGGGWAEGDDGGTATERSRGGRGGSSMEAREIRAGCSGHDGDVMLLAKGVGGARSGIAARGVQVCAPAEAVCGHWEDTKEKCAELAT